MWNSPPKFAPFSSKKISRLCQGKCSDTRCGEPLAIKNENARYNRNIGARKIFYWLQATSRGQPPLSKLNTKYLHGAFLGLNTHLYTKNRRQYSMGQYKLWINKYYSRLTKHMRPTTIIQTMDQQLLWDDLQSICIQQQYTNTVKRRIDMGS